MSISSWSVRFAVEEAEARAVSGVMHAMMGSDVRRLSISGPTSEDPGEPTTVTFELDAGDGREARIRAQHLLGKAKAAAGHRAEPSPIVWVTPLADVEASSHRFLEAAEELIDGEQYDLAVVAAQMHLETQVATLVQLAVASDDSLLAHAAVERQRGWAPHNASARPLLEALFDVRMDDFAHWAEYTAHARRRNDIVHGGQAVDTESAKESVAIVREFWLWLNGHAATASQT